MSDMLRGTCSRGCCGRGVNGANPRPADRRTWQQDVERGDYGTAPYTPDMSDGDLDHEWGGLADYMATPASYRDPLHPYGETHYRPMRYEDHERIELFKARMAERVKRIREERRNG